MDSLFRERQLSSPRHGALMLLDAETEDEKLTLTREERDEGAEEKAVDKLMRQKDARRRGFKLTECEREASSSKPDSNPSDGEAEAIFQDFDASENPFEDLDVVRTKVERVRGDEGGIIQGTSYIR